eukprot:812067-Amphidinium_carterae.2
MNTASKSTLGTTVNAEFPALTTHPGHYPFTGPGPRRVTSDLAAAMVLHLRHEVHLTYTLHKNKLSLSAQFESHSGVGFPGSLLACVACAAPFNPPTF